MTQFRMRSASHGCDPRPRTNVIHMLWIAYRDIVLGRNELRFSTGCTWMGGAAALIHMLWIAHRNIVLSRNGKQAAWVTKDECNPNPYVVDCVPGYFTGPKRRSCRWKEKFPHYTILFTQGAAILPTENGPALHMLWFAQRVFRRLVVSTCWYNVYTIRDILGRETTGIGSREHRDKEPEGLRLFVWFGLGFDAEWCSFVGERCIPRFGE